jgi:K+-sensing histidine kinase KdpD
MDQIVIPTKFASAERASLDKILLQKKIVENEKHLNDILTSIPNLALILNDERQAVLYNQELIDFLGYKDDLLIFGFRPGEILNCIHSDESEGGCGTTEFCRLCGAAKSILNSKSGKRDLRECRIMVKNKDMVESLDLLVSACPLEIEKQHFIFFNIVDISSEKRRKVLERVFFHDVLNTAGSVLGFLDLVKNSKDPQKTVEYINYLDICSKQLLDEIRSQQDLLSAETGELSLTIQPIQSLEVLKEIVEQYWGQFISTRAKIVIDPDSKNITFNSDHTLLCRVISNMLKNALESSSGSDVITVGCRIEDYQIEFWVNNPFVIPKDIQLQIFQRSFSTKNPNRGIGTYYMKLLTEKYLKGTVTFESNEETGTTFFARYLLDQKL